MVLSRFDWTLWIAVIASQGGVALRMAISGAWKRWPALFSFLLILTIKDLVRVSNVLTAANSLVDFWTFWVGSFLAELVEVWIIVEIGLSLGGISRYSRKLIRWGLPSLAAAFLLGTLVFSFDNHHANHQRLCFIVQRLDMAVGIAWLACFLILAICSEIIGIEWSRGARGIAAGFTLELMAATYVGWVIVHNPGSQAVLANIKSALYLISLAVWAASTGRPRPEENHRHILTEIARYLEAYKRLFERFEVHGQS